MAKPLKEWLKEAQKLDKEGLEEISHFKFFRDPPRPQFLSSGFILSPADGILIYQNIVEPDEPVVGVKGKSFTLKDLMQKEKYAKKSLVMGIFMTMWDVHVNRMPFSGFLKYISLPCLRTNNLSMTDFESILYEEGKIDYDAMDYVFYNERVLNTIYCPSLNYTFYLVQIADRDVDVICHFDDTNEFYYQSDRFSIIRWGSQVDMVFPLPLPYEYELIQEVGWHVEAGLDPLLAFI